MLFLEAAKKPRGTSDTFAGFLSEVQVFCGAPPTLLQGFCRRSKCFVGYLRRFCRVSVGGPDVLRGTSDAFAVFLSEVQVFCGVPPTLLPCFCRRSRCFAGYLRHFCRVSVGGPGVLRGTSDTFAVFMSEVGTKQAVRAFRPSSRGLL